MQYIGHNQSKLEDSKQAAPLSMKPEAQNCHHTVTIKAVSCVSLLKLVRSYRRCTSLWRLQIQMRYWNSLEGKVSSEVTVWVKTVNRHWNCIYLTEQSLKLQQRIVSIKGVTALHRLPACHKYKLTLMSPNQILSVTLTSQHQDTFDTSSVIKISVISL